MNTRNKKGMLLDDTDSGLDLTLYISTSWIFGCV